MSSMLGERDHSTTVSQQGVAIREDSVGINESRAPHTSRFSTARLYKARNVQPITSGSAPKGGSITTAVCVQEAMVYV